MPLVTHDFLTSFFCFRDKFVKGAKAKTNQSSNILRNSYVLPNLGIVAMLMVKNATIT